MNRIDIENILMSMRTQDNEAEVIFLLSKLSMLSDAEIANRIFKIGDSKELIESYLNNLLQTERISRLRSEEKYPINKLFQYGITNDSIHLHLPGRLQELIKITGSVTIAVNTVNLYLIDALNKIKNMKISNHHHLNNIRTIYMISPVLVKSELDFLNQLDFDTIIYSNDELTDTKFLASHSEAHLATSLFKDAVEKGQNIGRAQIPLDLILTSDWQKKKDAKVKGFNDKGIFIDENENIK